MSKGESIFLVMSYADEYYQVYSLFFHIATQRGIEAVRADEVASSIKKLRHGVFSKIRDAILVVVELSSGSPNVLYEAGWAHAMGCPSGKRVWREKSGATARRGTADTTRPGPQRYAVARIP